MTTEIRPEWAMVGWQANGRHWLLASRTLRSATLDWIAQTIHFESWAAFQRPGAFMPAWHIDIVGEGGRAGMVLINAGTYAECLADLLFKHGWRADAEPLHEVHGDPVKRALDARMTQRTRDMIEGEVVDD